MKSFILMMAAAIVSTATLSAENKPIEYNQLPETAKTFVMAHFPSAVPVLVTVEDDLIKPDYELMFEDGVKLDFYNNGSLKGIESVAGVPENLIPAKIVEYVKGRFPTALIVDYEVGRKTNEVKLSNGLELKFNKNSQLIELDD